MAARKNWEKVTLQGHVLTVDQVQRTRVGGQARKLTLINDQKEVLPVAVLGAASSADIWEQGNEILLYGAQVSHKFRNIGVSEDTAIGLRSVGWGWTPPTGKYSPISIGPLKRGTKRKAASESEGGDSKRKKKEKKMKRRSSSSSS